MTTFYIPVERKALPASDPLRWFMIEVDAPAASVALAEAEGQVSAMRLRNTVIWAAVRDCPPFAHMQEMREAMDVCRYARGGRKQGPIGSSIPGYC